MSSPPSFDSSISTTSSSDSIAASPKISCFFDSSTYQRQNFSIPEKILYYIAKNAKNAETFNKLVESCKYFFRINPVIVARRLECYGDKWYAYGQDKRYRIEFKYDQPIHFTIWVTHEFYSYNSDASKLIPSIYKNDATSAKLHCAPLKFEDFLFIVGNAEKLTMCRQLTEYENGEHVQLEDIVKSVPKLKHLYLYVFFGGDFIIEIFSVKIIRGFNTLETYMRFFSKPNFYKSDVNYETARKLLEIEHFKNVSYLKIDCVTGALDVQEMCAYVWENKHIEVDLFYRHDISDDCKELIREYSNRLKNEDGCKSKITFGDVMTHHHHDDESYADAGFLDPDIPSSCDGRMDRYDDSNVGFDDDEIEELLFPWKNEEDEEWELPWDKIDCSNIIYFFLQLF